MTLIVYPVAVHERDGERRSFRVLIVGDDRQTAWLTDAEIEAARAL